MEPARDTAILSGLHALEWRYDGPLPPGALAALEFDPAAIAARAAAADSALLDRLCVRAGRAVADARRGIGAVGPAGLDGHRARLGLLECRGMALQRRANPALSAAGLAGGKRP